MRRITRFLVVAIAASVLTVVPGTAPTAAEEGGPTVTEVPVAAGTDDAEEPTTGFPLLTSTDLELVDAEEGPGQVVGLRFADLGIPKHAVITEAWVQFTVDEVQADPTSLTIAGQLSNNAPTFASTLNDVSQRPSTVATVPWTPDPWLLVGSALPASRTPDLSPVVQEVVHEPGWNVTSPLTLTFRGTGHRTAAAEEHALFDPPRLHVAYLPATADISVDAQVGLPADDAEEAPTGVVTRSSGDLELVHDADAAALQTVGLRFAGLDLPRGAVIQRAWIQFTADEVQSEPTDLTITAHAVDNAPKLGPNNANVSSRNLTDASVAWSPPPWTRVGSAAPPQRTPDLTALVQEVVDRPFWVGSGGALAFMFRGTGHRTAVAFDQNPALAPALHIDYLPGTPAPFDPEVHRYAVIGDFGTGGEQAGRLANLVNTMGVEDVLTVGDNSYGANPIDENIGRHYLPYIGGYHGAYGSGATTNRFWPSLGNHDYTDGGGLPAYLDYFDLPGNERYYDVVLGPLHVFAINSNFQEPDGVTANSVQGQWLRDALAASTAPWQVVLLHHSPFSSGLGHGPDPRMQWPYAEWGVDLVLSGHDHDYERLEVDGTPYVITGLGGASRYAQGPVDPHSVFFTNTDEGAVLLEVCDGRIDLSFHTVSSGVLDTRRLGGPTCDVPTVTASATGATATEGGGDGEVTVTRTGATNRPLNVDYSVGGTAATGDVGPLSGTVRIPAGADHATIPIAAVDDAEVEDDETVVVTLTDAADRDVGTEAAATVTVDSDDVPSVTVEATDGQAAEAGLDPGTFTIRRTGPTTGPLDVAFTLGGSATEDADYLCELPGTATIPAGSESTTVTVTPVDDPAVEADETVELSVTDGATYDLGTPATASVTLRSDDVQWVSQDLFATSQTRPYGVTTAGGLLSLRTSDNQRLVVREELGSGANPNSLLEYRATLAPLPATFRNLTLVVEAHHTVNSEGDDLLVDWSRNGGPFHALVTVTKTADNGTAQFKQLPSWIQPGDVVTLRVRDANRTPGRRQLDSAHLDRLFLRAQVPA